MKVYVPNCQTGDGRKKKLGGETVHEGLHVHFSYFKTFFRPLPQRNRHNDGNHPVMKTIISLTGKIICDGAAVVKSPETLRIFYFHGAMHHREIKIQG